MVSIEWLLHSLDKGKKLDEGPYLFSQPTTTNNGTSQSKDKGKMKAEVSDDDNGPKDSIAIGKKRPLPDSTSNGKTGIGIGDNDKDEHPAKKMKDGQKANSGSLSVPVDEGCHLARESVPDWHLIPLLMKATSDSSSVYHRQQRSLSHRDNHGCHPQSDQYRK